MHIMKREDMLNKRFGRQTVVGLPPEKDKVIVQCDCGRIHTVRAETITRKNLPFSPAVASDGKRRQKSVRMS